MPGAQIRLASVGPATVTGVGGEHLFEFVQPFAAGAGIDLRGRDHRPERRIFGGERRRLLVLLEREGRLAATLSDHFLANQTLSDPDLLDRTIHKAIADMNHEHQPRGYTNLQVA